MSVRLMSQVFEYAFPKRVEYVSLDYTFKRDKETKQIISKSEQPTERTHATTGTSCKFVLLALADHANDDGKGAYPSTPTLCKKTNLEKPTVIAALLALRYWGFIDFVGESPRETNNYDICPGVLEIEFAEIKAKKPVQVNQAYLGGKPSLPGGVNPAYLGGKPSLPESSFNHPLTDNKDIVFAALTDNKIICNPLMIGDMLTEWEEHHEQRWILLALKKGAGKHINYANQILVGWGRDGYPEEHRTPAQGPKQPRPQKTSADDLNNALAAWVAGD